jgi:hypothetical protein
MDKHAKGNEPFKKSVQKYFSSEGKRGWSRSIPSNITICKSRCPEDELPADSFQDDFGVLRL